MTGGGQAVITVDYGSALKLSGTTPVAPDFGGQPQEAAAWVAYANADPSIYGTANDVTLGVDQQGNNWRTAGYWAKLRASTPAQYQTWATADGVYNAQNSFLAINRAAGAGIKYWEIGNETFGTGYYDNSGSPSNGYSTDYHVPYPYTSTARIGNANLSPAHYGQQVVQYSQLMKQVDPTIKIGAVLSTPPDDYANWDYYPKTGGANNPANKHWNPEVLSQPGISSAVDFVMVHWYPYAGLAYTSFTDTMWNGQPLNGKFDYTDSNHNGQYDVGEPSEPVTPNTGTSLVAYPAQKIDTMINGAGTHTGMNEGVKDYLNQFGLPNAKIMITEFNYNGTLWTGSSQPGQDTTNYAPAANSLFVADSYANWLEDGVTSVQYLELSQNNFVGDASSLTRGSAFWAIKMLNLASDPGDSAVNATSDTSTLRVHSYKRADGSVAVMILNEGTAAQNVNVSINGSALLPSGTLYTTTGTSITTTSVTGLGNSFAVSGIPGRTIYTYIIPQRLSGDYNGDGIVDAADYTVWQDTAGQTGANLAADGTGPSGTPDGVVDNLDYQFWVDHFGATSAGSGAGSSVAVPEPASVVTLAASSIALFVCGRGMLDRARRWPPRPALAGGFCRRSR
jgi:hypothetical protein